MESGHPVPVSRPKPGLDLMAVGSRLLDFTLMMHGCGFTFNKRERRSCFSP